MVQICVVRGCVRSWYPGCTIKYHSFPKDPSRRNLWLSIVPLKSKFHEGARICSLHFHDEDYDYLTKRLKQTAVPFITESTFLKETPFDDTYSDLGVPSTSYGINVSVVQIDDVRMKDVKTSNDKQQSSNVLGSLSNAQESFTEDFVDMAVPSTSSGIITQVDEIRDVLYDITSIENQRSTLGSHNDMEQTGDENLPVKVDKGVQVELKTSKEEIIQKKNKLLMQKVSRQTKRIDSMKSLLAVVKNYTHQTELENILQGRFTDICKEFKKKTVKVKGIRYSEEVKAFALTLNFYSPKAYTFLKKLINLPHVETLRRSLRLVECNVGFLSEVLEYLKDKVKLPENRHLKNVALIFDGMSLKEDLAIDQKLGKVFGYVDLGPILVDDSEQLASEALVFQIVSYTKKLKCPIAYFFIRNCLAGELLSELIKTAIILLHEIGITVRSLTSDGASSNIKAYECLGCSLNNNDFKPYFQHPNGQSNVYCLLDAAHMLKLARNTLGEYVIKSETGDISFDYVRKLYEVQNEEGLKFANKLSSQHINYKNKKMNVRLAAQVLSTSVADAIDFLRASRNPDFENSGATTEFLHMIDRIFDLMNSKSPFGKNYKSPLSLKNKKYWELVFSETEVYLKSLSINGIDILKHPRKTFVLGFLMNITNFSFLVMDLCTMEENPLEYLLTFKCSQDNIEIFFSCIRARGRASDNPSPLEFRYIMRKMLFRNAIQPSLNANCIDNDFESSHIIDFNTKSKNLLEPPKEHGEIDEDLWRNLDQVENSPYQDNILYYITGYIVKHIIAHISCSYCHDLLISSDFDQSYKDHMYCIDVNKYQTFTTFINRGKLYFPSKAAFEVVRHTDKVFKRAVSMGQLKANNVHIQLLNMIMQYFTPLLQKMFPHPATNSITCSDQHETIIVKRIANSYLKSRIKSHLKKETDKMLGHLRGKRQKLHKLVIFSHV